MSIAAWRPRNETADDLAREYEAAIQIRKAWRIDIEKLSEALYHVDWCISRKGKVIGFGEYKYRKAQYDSVILSLAKFSHGRRWANTCHGRFCLFIEWDRIGLHYADLTDIAPSKILMGGNSRGQNGDTEPVVHIPTSMFIHIDTGAIQK